MGKKTKTRKVKGYGAYWSGHIKNKHIARKNDQYIRDQKYLHVYKKIKDSSQDDQALEISGSDLSPTANSTQDSPKVKTIKPQVETSYFLHSDDESLPHLETKSAHSDQEAPISEPEPKTENHRSGDPYSKVIKKRKELEKQQKEAYDLRVEEIKKKRREIRARKQKRYERHRLLGVKTKKGQPIMKNVIKHIMRNFKPD